MHHLPTGSTLTEFEEQSRHLLKGYRNADPEALEIVKTRHPRFLDDKILWLPKRISEEELLHSGLTIDDAQLALARWYDFKDWPSLIQFVADSASPDSPAGRFERAADCVTEGNIAALRTLLERDPALVHARSRRITWFDPPVHSATLLHYVAANGVEGYRQRTPPNALEAARLLLETGAQPDAFAQMYGEPATPLTMLVSSSHPFEAGLQMPIAALLLDAGAAVDGYPFQRLSPILTALVFGYPQTAELLAGRGASITLAAAAGLGRTEQTRALLAGSEPREQHRAFALACQLGHPGAARLLLEAGADPDRYNPDGFHAHATPLHQAVWANHLDVVRLLIEHGAQLDLRDKIYNATPLEWAKYGDRTEIAAYLDRS